MNSVKPSPQHCKRHLFGFNLIEAAIVLGIIGLVIGGIWIAASSVAENMKINKTTTAILTGVQRLREVVPREMATGTYVGFDYSFMINANIFPADMVSAGATITPWNTPLVAGVTGSGSTAYLQITIGIPNKSVCLRLTSTISSRFTGQSNLGYIFIGPANTTYTVWPLSPTGTQCDGQTYPHFISMLFTF